MRIKAITEIEKPDNVYNLHVKKNHNYLANGIIASNCHQAKAEILKGLLTTSFKDCPIRWGLTGTMPKEDHEFLSILSSLGPVVGNLAAKELQDKGVLSNCHVEICQIQDKQSFGDYHAEQKFLSENDERLEWVSKFIEKVSKESNSLVLVNKIATGEWLQNKIPNSVFISGKVKSSDRKDEYDLVSSEDGKIIIATYGVAAVGINIPRIFNLFLFEPGKSFVRVIQSIGRGLRKAKDKDYVQIYDLTSSCKFSKRHLTARKKFYKDAGYPFRITKITL